MDSPSAFLSNGCYDFEGSEDFLAHEANPTVSTELGQGLDDDILGSLPSAPNDLIPLLNQDAEAQSESLLPSSSRDAFSVDEPNTHSYQYLRQDNERLRNIVSQQREATEDWQQRVTNARNHVGSLERLVEDVLSHSGLPVDVYTRLFEASNILTQLRKDVN